MTFRLSSSRRLPSTTIARPRMSRGENQAAGPDASPAMRGAPSRSDERKPSSSDMIHPRCVRRSAVTTVRLVAASEGRLQQHRESAGDDEDRPCRPPGEPPDVPDTDPAVEPAEQQPEAVAAAVARAEERASPFPWRSTGTASSSRPGAADPLPGSPPAASRRPRSGKSPRSLDSPYPCRFCPSHPPPRHARPALWEELTPRPRPCHRCVGGRRPATGELRRATRPPSWRIG